MCPYSIITIRSEARLLQLAQFDASAYGEKDVAPDILARWWRAFPIGIRVAQADDGRILGAMSAWPLLPQTYDRVRDGKISESAITPADFDLASTHKARWYISGIAVAPELRGSARFLLSFLSDGLAALRREARVLAPDICAIAASREGERMLRRFGFERRADAPIGSAYERRAFRDERLQTLAAEHAAHERTRETLLVQSA